MIYILHKKREIINTTIVRYTYKYSVTSYCQFITQDIIDSYPTQWRIKESEINNDIRWVEFAINNGPDCIVFLNDKIGIGKVNNGIEDAVSEFKIKLREEKINEVLEK